jgi:hypothetical protein
MRTGKEATELIDYWANKHAETVDEILANLEFCDDNSQNALTEQVAYFVDDVNFLRKHAHNLRVNPR